ncbi:hypothetical protein A3K64_00460 [Candidatus Micrarchaeota archaeon RBG_16_36_9]|nr:MAG: hypothetical protein A3K64_00460 [Candidatus Micrarchaeota archaeon RBG_16_36_9]
MKIKQFLKPDWRKIVLFVLMLLFVPIPISFQLLLPTPLGINIFAKNHSWIMFIYSLGFTSRISAYDELILISLPIIYYLFSCFIVWIYDKVKKKK